MKRILSGMQPTAQLHLGNYLGALKNWVGLQDEPDARNFYMVADLHAITADYEPSALAQATREIAAAYIAGGIDPDKSDIFVQSSVSAHSEAMWLLSTMTQMGKLERMTQFKDKAGKNAERAGLGLFSYPVLMAADILLYQATHVPVGEDQKQHLELTRDVAATFETKYGEGVLTAPEPMIMGEATRVMSLQDGTKKMSKSDPSEKSRVNLIDDPDTIVKKIKKAKTDQGLIPELVEGLEGRPEVANLVTIYAALSGQGKADVLNEFAGQQFGPFKAAMADVVVAHLAPITARMRDLLANPDEIDHILAKGNLHANEVASQTIDDMQRVMGFWRAH
jgi:tryptophanyl-tRNA synthetase